MDSNDSRALITKFDLTSPSGWVITLKSKLSYSNMVVLRSLATPVALRVGPVTASSIACFCGEVYPISHTFITKDNKRYTFRAEKYAYAYVERKDGIVTLKIYQPKSTVRKWCNSGNASVWDLWSQLPKTGNKLFFIIIHPYADSKLQWFCLKELVFSPIREIMSQHFA